MSRHLLAIAVATAFAVTLAGCSSSGGSDDGDGGNAGGTDGASTGNGGGGGQGGGQDGGQGGDTGATPAPGGNTTAANPDGSPPTPSGGGAPSGDTKAGTYLGDFGFGTGVYVIDTEDRLAGLSLADNGEANALFGELGEGNTYSGTLRRQVLDPSNPPDAGGFGTGDPTLEAVGPYELSFTPGDSITSTGGEQSASLSVAGEGALQPATVASVAGSWRGVNEYGDCSGTAGCRLVFEITFDGTSVSGSTSVETGAGESSFENPIAGSIAEYGDVLLLSFNWSSGERLAQYDGVAFFTTDGTGRLVFLGETLAGGDNPVIASLLARP